MEIPYAKKNAPRYWLNHFANLLRNVRKHLDLYSSPSCKLVTLIGKVESFLLCVVLPCCLTNNTSIAKLLLQFLKIWIFTKPGCRSSFTIIHVNKFQWILQMIIFLVIRKLLTNLAKGLPTSDLLNTRVKLDKWRELHISKMFNLGPWGCWFRLSNRAGCWGLAQRQQPPPLSSFLFSSCSRINSLLFHSALWPHHGFLLFFLPSGPFLLHYNFFFFFYEEPQAVI